MRSSAWAPIQITAALIRRGNVYTDAHVSKAIWRHKESMAICEPRREVSNQLWRHLHLRILVSPNREKINFCCFSHSIWKLYKMNRRLPSKNKQNNKHIQYQEKGLLAEKLLGTLRQLGGASGKEPICQSRRLNRWEYYPWVRKIPWRRKWLPTPVFLPGKSLGQRSLVGYSP